jgi:hypothetical protein
VLGRPRPSTAAVSGAFKTAALRRASSRLLVLTTLTTLSVRSFALEGEASVAIRADGVAASRSPPPPPPPPPLHAQPARFPHSAPPATMEGPAAELYEASMTGDLERAEAALAAGAPPSVRNVAGLTPLHIACGGTGPPPLVAALLAAGADADARDGSGWTPLI